MNKADIFGNYLEIRDKNIVKRISTQDFIKSIRLSAIRECIEVFHDVFECKNEKGEIIGNLGTIYEIKINNGVFMLGDTLRERISSIENLLTKE